MCCCTILLTNFLPCYINTSTLRACLHGGGGLQVGEVTCGGSPHLSCKRDQIKMRDYMDRRVTPPKRVTSSTWGPPLPCKQASSHASPLCHPCDFFLWWQSFFFFQLLPILEMGLHRRSMIRMLSCFLSVHRNLRILHSLDDWSCC